MGFKKKVLAHMVLHCVRKFFITTHNTNSLLNTKYDTMGNGGQNTYF